MQSKVRPTTFKIPRNLDRELKFCGARWPHYTHHVRRYTDSVGIGLKCVCRRILYTVVPCSFSVLVALLPKQQTRSPTVLCSKLSFPGVQRKKPRKRKTKKNINVFYDVMPWPLWTFVESHLCVLFCHLHHKSFCWVLLCIDAVSCNVISLHDSGNTYIDSSGFTYVSTMPSHQSTQPQIKNEKTAQEKCSPLEVLVVHL